MRRSETKLRSHLQCLSLKSFWTEAFNIFSHRSLSSCVPRRSLPLSPAPLLALLAFFPSPSSRPLFRAKHLRSASLLAPLREENRGFLRGPPFSGVSSSICNEPCASSCAVSTASELCQRAVQLGEQAIADAKAEVAAGLKAAEEKVAGLLST